jgi:hypothetical protein
VRPEGVSCVLPLRRAPKDYGKVLSKLIHPDSRPQGVPHALPPKRAPKHFGKTSIELLRLDFLTLAFGFVLVTGSLIASHAASHRGSQAWQRRTGIRGD